MFKIAIVVFRECLEIAILLGIIMAMTSPIKNSRIYILIGSLTGVILASLFAIFASHMVEMYDGLGDDVFNSFIILLSALIVSWTVVWMQGYATKVKKDFGKLTESINAGNISKITLVFVVAMAILREGMEIILFLYSIITVEDLNGHNYIISIFGGGALGFLSGSLLYLGLINSGRYIFKVSAILLTLIAAGLASEAAGILTSSGIIELMSDQLWDTSWLIDNRSTLGKILSITVGYDAKPNGMQLIFYISTIALVIFMVKLRSFLSEREKER